MGWWWSLSYESSDVLDVDALDVMEFFEFVFEFFGVSFFFVKFKDDVQRFEPEGDVASFCFEDFSSEGGDEAEYLVLVVVEVCCCVVRHDVVGDEDCCHNGMPRRLFLRLSN